ncbi:MAG: hypothetical protein ACYDCO_10985 [Armatimonadota bacterium]
MTDTTVQPKRTRRSPRPRLRVTRVVFVFLLILVAVCWHFRPSTPQLVSSFPVRGEQLWVRSSGFFTVADDVFSARESSKVICRWWYGNEAWSVRLPKPDLTGWRLSPADASWNGRAFSVAPQGQRVALAYADGRQVQVVSWQDSRVQGRLQLPVSPQGPITGRAAFSIQALDDGQVLLWLTSAPVSPVLLIKGDKVLMTAAHRSMLTVEPGFTFERRVSPDMRWMIGYKQAKSSGAKHATPELECATLEVTKTALTLYPYYTVPHITHPVLFNGAIVSANGGIYRRRSETVAPDGWVIAQDLEPQPDCAVQYKGASARVLTPNTLKSWGLPHLQPSWRVTISQGGRYAAAYDAASSRSTGILADRPSAWSEFFSLIFTPRHVNLYTRPGKLLRAMKLPGSRETIQSAHLSPDGTYLLLRTADPSTKKAEYLMYRMPPEVWKRLEREK